MSLLSQEDLVSFDEGDQDLDDLLQGMPPSLQKKKKTNTTINSIIKNNTPPNNSVSVLVSLQERANRLVPPNRTYPHCNDIVQTADLGWFVVRKRKRVKESFQYYAESYWPCRICPPHSTAAASFLLVGDPKKKDNECGLVIQYLGFHSEKSHKLDWIQKHEFVPLDYVPTSKTPTTKRGKKRRAKASLSQSSVEDEDVNVNVNEDNEETATSMSTPIDRGSDKATPSHKERDSSNTAATSAKWSPVLLQKYRQTLLKKQGHVMNQTPDFWNQQYANHHQDNSCAVADFWWNVETNFLQNVLQQVKQQQQQALASPTPCPNNNHGLVENNGEHKDDKDKDDEGRSEHEHDATRDSTSSVDNVNAAAATSHHHHQNDDTETTPFVAKLRAGDEITYYPPVSVVSAANGRIARIFCVHGKHRKNTKHKSLELDNHELVGVDSLVCLRQRFLRGKLVPVDKICAWAVEKFDLDQSMNGKVDFLRAKFDTNLVSRDWVEDTWAECVKQHRQEQVQQECDSDKPGKTPLDVAAQDDNAAKSATPLSLVRQPTAAKSSPKEPPPKASPHLNVTSRRKPASETKRARPKNEENHGERRRSLRIRSKAP